LACCVFPLARLLCGKTSASICSCPPRRWPQILLNRRACRRRGAEYAASQSRADAKAAEEARVAAEKTKQTLQLAVRRSRAEREAADKAAIAKSAVGKTCGPELYAGQGGARRSAAAELRRCLIGGRRAAFTALPSPPSATELGKSVAKRNLRRVGCLIGSTKANERGVAARGRAI